MAQVDTAMAEERPEKTTMRKLWVECVGEVCDQRVGDEPIYLTLGGREGRDIDCLIEKGHLRRAENATAIVPDDFGKVIAVESRREAELALQKKFPGLKVIRVPFHNLLASESPLAWPTGEYRRICRARVVNLDLSDSLGARVLAGQLHFPALVWVQKLGQLHAHHPQLDWTLCLTLQGQIEWSEEVERRVKAFLAENLGTVERFAEAAEGLLGGELVEGIRERSEDLRLSGLSRKDQQHLLMALVPKRIARDASQRGWRVDTRRNLRYGGVRRRAPMVSWIFDFRWDERSSSEPAAVYQQSLVNAVSQPGEIDPDGNLVALS